MKTSLNTATNFVEHLALLLSFLWSEELLQTTIRNKIAASWDLTVAFYPCIVSLHNIHTYFIRPQRALRNKDRTISYKKKYSRIRLFTAYYPFFRSLILHCASRFYHCYYLFWRVFQDQSVNWDYMVFPELRWVLTSVHDQSPDNHRCKHVAIYDTHRPSQCHSISSAPLPYITLHNHT